MLTFTPAQFHTFQTSWQSEQLCAQLPAVLAPLAAQYPAFYAENTDEQHRYHGEQLIGRAVTYGYTSLEHMQQLLGLEYQTRCQVLDHPSLKPLYQARWLQPDDRLSSMQALVDLKHHTDPGRVCAYRSLEEDPLVPRCQAIAAQAALVYATADGTPDQHSAPAVSLQRQRQALYHALLKDSLRTSQGWQAWQSDGQQARIGLEHKAYRRRLQLQTADGPAWQATLDEDTGMACLNLSLPDRIDSAQHHQIDRLLQHWALQLHSIEQMQAQIEPPHQPEPEPNPSAPPTGETHA